MSFGFGFALPAYPLRGGGGNNPFNQLGPTLDLSFVGTAGDLSGADTYTLNTDFITPEYQVAAQYAIWENGVGLAQKTFSQIVTFSRTSGATWFNSAGVNVGIDFSTSSVTIGTGSKTFTLTATAGIDRSWAAGDIVRISEQATPANFMDGTVTSYTASTQTLVVNVTATGGSGTIASWRVSNWMPRFDYDPATLLARGLLIEEARTNSIRNNTMQGAVNSTGIASATVASGGTGYTVGNVLTVSGGTGTAATFTVTGASAGVITSVSVTTAGSYTVFPTSPVSVTGGSGSGATFNIVLNGTPPNDWFGTAPTGITRAIVGTGTEDGITYIDFRFNGTATAAGAIQVGFATTNQIAATVGQTFAQSLYWKLVAGSTANLTTQRIFNNEYSSTPTYLRSNVQLTSFPTSASLATQRVSFASTMQAATCAFVQPCLGADVANGAAIDITLRIGLPQLENNNISTGVASATVASGGSGYAIGDVLQIVGGTASTAARLTVATLSGSAVATVTVSTAGSYSVFPSPQPVSVTAITGTGTSATFNIVPQAQSGFATSVIPTTVAAATRNADVASVNTLSPWFNQTEGTLFAEYVRLGATNFQAVAYLGTPAQTDYAGLVFGSGAPSNNQRFDVGVGGLSQASITVLTTPALNTVSKTAGAYKANDFAATANGAAPGVDPSGSIPTVTALGLGTGTALTGPYLNGYLRRITYYPRRLTNAELQTITT